MHIDPTTQARLQHGVAYFACEGQQGRATLTEVWDDGVFVAHKLPTMTAGQVMSLKLPARGGHGPMTLKGTVIQVVDGEHDRSGCAIKIDVIHRRTVAAPPRPKRRPPREPRTSHPPPSRRAPTEEFEPSVLIVEDDRVQAKLLLHWLTAQGHTVVVALNPETALDLARKHTGSLEVAVVDSMLPGCEGRQLFGRLKGLVKRLRIVAISGVLTAVTDRDECLKAGAAAFLAKPLVDHELCDAVGKRQFRVKARPESSASN